MWHPFPEDRTKAIQRARKYISRNPLFLDTETTGLTDSDEIVEIAVVDLQGQVLINSLVKPAAKLDWAAAADIHGINQNTVAEAPTFRDLLPELEQILRGSEVLVYNMDFDKGKIERSARAAQCEFELPFWWSRPVPGHPGLEEFDAEKTYRHSWHDVMNLYAMFYGEWNDYRQSYRWQRLGAAALQCGIDLPTGIYRAHADAETCRRIVLYMAEQPIEEASTSEEIKDE